MIVYRISTYVALDGKGAAKQYNNRWNSYGTRIVYTSGSIACAKGELSRRTPLNLLPPGFIIFSIELPNDQIAVCENLPTNWDESPPNELTKTIGDRFVLKNTTLALEVPSVYDKVSKNYLINPLHQHFEQVQVVREEPLYF